MLGGRGYTWVGAGRYGKSLYLPLNFAVNLNLFKNLHGFQMASMTKVRLRIISARAFQERILNRSSRLILIALLYSAMPHSLHDAPRLLCAHLHNILSA